MRIQGENFTPEYKYPIKIYRMGQVEFANGLEIRKMMFAIVLALLMVVLFFVFGVQEEERLLPFIFHNWLILLTVIPAVVTFVTFNLRYDHKGFFAFCRDRLRFYRTRNQAYEHFLEVPMRTWQQPIRYEAYHRKEGRKDP
ncbi:TcpE family conjugal transfer membrane protein [Thalassobacillus pellis]|uniref:TcpE family conjugal transfer membrane protein n=1 Tax=Thalassobacillus pellis TaxID=748008 RepID=UPI0030841057|nr:glucan phosphoethanolaminetransferase (alkaline phosphatase superfamily) [Thalassobacillus pellis]